MEELEVETGIVGCGGLPLQVLVVGIRTVKQTRVVDTEDGIASVDVVVVHIIRGKIVVVANAVLLTSLTPAKAELDLVNPIDVAQWCLLIDFPTESN